MNALKFLLEWARENHVGPLQTALMAASVVGLFFFSRFVRSAKGVIKDVHHVYEQALEDEKRASASLREQLMTLEQARRRLFDELEAERQLKEELLRTLARARAKNARRGKKQED